ncbi:hypothetical protein [Nitrincola sp.]|uniref:hypothetical protein n=1 Tax=Nitrincola sp. TaxID=1926584 RepID=UPI003A94A84E
MNDQPPSDQSPFPILPLLVHDVELNTACVPCQAASSCCRFQGKIKDAADPTRFISWPLCPTEQQPNPSTRLLVIADQADINAPELFARVNVTREGDECRKPPVSDQAASIHYQILDKDNELSLQTAAAQDHFIRMQDTAHWGLLDATTHYAKWVPRQTLITLTLLDSLRTLDQQLSGRTNTRFTPMLCGNYPPSRAEFQVIPFPELKISGTVRWGVVFTLRTRAPFVSAQSEESTSLDLVYGNTKISQGTEKTSDASASLSEPSPNAPAPGFFGILDKLIGDLSDTQQKGRPRPDSEQPNTDHGSRVTFSVSAELTVGGVELKPKSNSPDLELELGGIKFTTTAGVTGTIDVIETAVTMFAPATARRFTEVRGQLARGKRVSGDLQANLILALKGETQRAIDSDQALTLYAHPDPRATYAHTGFKYTLSGQYKVFGKAELSFHVGLEVWGVRAKAGAAGSLHTSWCVEFRHASDNGQCQYRNYFEGLKAEVSLYAKVDTDDTAAEAGGGMSNSSNTSSTQVELHQTSSSVFEQVAANNEASARQAQELRENAVRIKQLNTAEAKQVLRDYALVNPIARGSEIERLETSLAHFPNDNDNQTALMSLLAEVSKDYHDYQYRDRLGELHELLAPSPNGPITENNPKWKTFSFGASD